MSTVTDSRRPRPTDPNGDRIEGPRATFAQLRAALDRPMASQHLVVASAGLLLGLGLMMVLSSSSVMAANFYDDSYYFVKRQLVFLAVGVPIAWTVSRMPTKLLHLIAVVALIGSIAMLALIFVPGLGSAAGGNNNWLVLGSSSFLRIQPSEFAKVAIVLWGASVLANKERRLDEPFQLVVPYLPLVGVIIGLVVLQRDLGTALVMGLIMLGVMWMAGAPKRIFFSLVLLAGAGVSVLVLLSPNRVGRFLAFLNPGTDEQGVNMQSSVGLDAIASGGWWGRGLGGSLEKWGRLSAAHTDFVFAVIAEELGLIGSLTVLALFLVLGYAGLRIALRADRPFHRYLAIGITTWLLGQALINIAVVIRWGPVMGVPLPLVSYGGSALLANLIAIGLLINCARNEPDARELLTGKRTRRAHPRVSTVVAADRDGR